ncbi:unnamed protein product [Brassica rapa subsp. narinosa]
MTATQWSFIRYSGEKKAESSGASYSSQFSEAFTKFYGQSKATTANEASESSKSVPLYLLVKLGVLK